MRYFLIVFISIVLATSCKKDLLQVNEEYVGVWVSYDHLRTVFVIREDGTAEAYEYLSESEGNPFEFSGDAFIRSNKMIIDGKKFKIIEPVHQVDPVLVDPPPGYGMCCPPVPQQATWSMRLRDPLMWGEETKTYFRID